MSSSQGSAAGALTHGQVELASSLISLQFRWASGGISLSIHLRSVPFVGRVILVLHFKFPSLSFS